MWMQIGLVFTLLVVGLLLFIYVRKGNFTLLFSIETIISTLFILALFLLIGLSFFISLKGYLGLLFI